LLIIFRRFFGIPPFRFYALADGIRAILAGSRCASSVELPPNLQLDRLLAWEVVEKLRKVQVDFLLTIRSRQSNLANSTKCHAHSGSGGGGVDCEL
jgi:hypothetical protein